jgi:type IV secretion system protein VirB1
VARTESGFQPLAINDNTTGTRGVPATSDIAIQIATKLIEGGHSVDVGIMQINSSNFVRLGLTLEAAFDPCRSIAAAAVILAGDYAGGETHQQQQSALRVALSKYNTGDAQRGFANGYVQQVELAARRVVPAPSDPAGGGTGRPGGSQCATVLGRVVVLRLRRRPPSGRRCAGAPDAGVWSSGVCRCGQRTGRLGHCFGSSC